MKTQYGVPAAAAPVAGPAAAPVRPAQSPVYADRMAPPPSDGQHPSAVPNRQGYAPLVTNASPESYVTDHGTHEGGPAADVFAPLGSPIYAPIGGTVTPRAYPLGGNTGVLAGDDGRFYYMAHGAVPFTGGRVEAGQQIGQVGQTGNAGGTAPHVHFAVATDPDFSRGVNGGSGNVWFGSEMWTTSGAAPSPTSSGMPQAGLPAPRTGAGVDRGGDLDPSSAPTPVWQLADAKSAAWGLGDPNVLRALILAESGGNPGEIGDSGQSYGLLQAYTGPGGGRGSGHDPRRLLDPEYNLDIARDEIVAGYRQALREGFREGTPALARRVGELAQRPDPAYYHRYADAYATLQGGGPPGTEGVVPPGGSVLGGPRTGPAGVPYPGSPAARGQVGSPFGPSYPSDGEYAAPTALPDPFAALRAGQRTLDETLERTRRGIAGLPSAALGQVNGRVAGLPSAVDDAFTPARNLSVDRLLHPFPPDNPVNAQYRRNVEAAGGTIGDPASVALAHSPNSITNQVDRALQAAGAPPMTERQKTTLDYALQTLPIGEADIRVGAEGAAGALARKAPAAVAKAKPEPWPAALQRAADVHEPSGSLFPHLDTGEAIQPHGYDPNSIEGTLGAALDARAAAQGTRFPNLSAEELRRYPGLERQRRSVAERRALMHLGLPAKDWYSAIGDFFARFTGAQNAGEAASLFGVTATRAEVAHNAMATLDVMATVRRLRDTRGMEWLAPRIREVADAYAARGLSEDGGVASTPLFKEVYGQTRADGIVQLPDNIAKALVSESLGRVGVETNAKTPSFTSNTIAGLKRLYDRFSTQDVFQARSGGINIGQGQPEANYGNDIYWYRASHAITDRLARELGITPYQAQAAEWVSLRTLLKAMDKATPAEAKAGVLSMGKRLERGDVSVFDAVAEADARGHLDDWLSGSATHEIEAHARWRPFLEKLEARGDLDRLKGPGILPDAEFALVHPGKAARGANPDPRFARMLPAEKPTPYPVTPEAGAALRTAVEVNAPVARIPSAALEAAGYDAAQGRFVGIDAPHIVSPTAGGVLVAFPGGEANTARFYGAEIARATGASEIAVHMPDPRAATLGGLRVRGASLAALRESLARRGVPSMLSTHADGLQIPHFGNADAEDAFVQNVLDAATESGVDPSVVELYRGGVSVHAQQELGRLGEALRPAYRATGRPDLSVWTRGEGGAARGGAGVGGAPAGPAAAPGHVGTQAALLGGAAAGLGGAGYLAATMPGLEGARRRLGEVAGGIGDTVRDVVARGPASPFTADNPINAQLLANRAERAAEPETDEQQQPFGPARLLGGLESRITGRPPSRERELLMEAALQTVPLGAVGTPGAAAPTALETAGRQYRAFVAANLLSGVPGIVRNIGGGPAILASEVGTTALSPLNELALRMLRGGITRLPVVGGGSTPARSRFLSELVPTLRGAVEGVGPGAKAGLEALVGKATPAAGSTGVGGEIVGGRVMPLNWVLRAYSANDAAAGAVGARLGDRQAALRIARQRGGRAPSAALLDLLTDLGRRERAGDTSIPPILKGAARAVRAQGDAVADRLTVRDGFGALDDTLAALNRNVPFFGPLLVPFSRGVNAAVKSAYQHSPLALGELVVRGAKALKTPPPEGYGELSDRLARMEMGVGAMAGAAALYNAGIMTGARPTNRKLAKEWDAAGNVEYSFNLGEYGGHRYHLPFSMITPVGPNLMATANAMDAAREGKPATEVAQAAAAGWYDGMGNLPFMQGWADVAALGDAIGSQDPAKLVAAAERVAKSRVPGLVPASGFLRTQERGTDPYRRAAATLGQSVQAGLPVVGGGLEEPPPGEEAPLGAGARAFLRTTPAADVLAPRISPQRVAGQPIPTGATYLGATFSPARESAPIAEGRAQLAEAARTGVPFPTAPDTVRAQGGPVELTPAQRDRYAVVQGDLALRYRGALAATPKYRAAPLEQQQEWQRRTNALANADAREQVLAENDLAPPRAEGEPERYDLQRLAPALRTRLPAATVDEYVAHPALFEAATRKAARKLALYKASRGTTPRPATAELLLAQMASPTARTAAWQRWSRDPARRRAAAQEDSFIAELGLPPDEPPPPTDTG